MATCFGEIDDTPVEKPNNEETDNASEDESRDEDLIRQVLTEMANIKQFVEEKYNEPREAIHDRAKT